MSDRVERLIGEARTNAWWMTPPLVAGPLVAAIYGPWLLGLGYVVINNAAVWFFCDERRPEEWLRTKRAFRLSAMLLLPVGFVAIYANEKPRHPPRSGAQ